MNQVPTNPKIYHITHVDNLPKIIAQGGLWSDREMIDQGLNVNAVGLAEIKSRRLNEYQVTCHPGTKVGDFVPFYFCPRSVMLSVFWYDNLPELTYHGGQGPIVHLRADMMKCREWASQHGVPFAFSDMNAGMATAEFFNRKSELSRIDWEVVGSNNFAGDRKHRKAAEFLIHRFFPWELVERIGVIDDARLKAAKKAIAVGEHQPPVTIKPKWYF